MYIDNRDVADAARLKYDPVSATESLEEYLLRGYREDQLYIVEFEKEFQATGNRRFF